MLTHDAKDDDGYAVKLRLEYYHLYQEVSEDDSPLYIFDGTFGDKSGKKSLLSDYEVTHMWSSSVLCVLYSRAWRICVVA